MSARFWDPSAQALTPAGAGQVSAPEYKLLITPLSGEHRFAAGVAVKMQKLGALTKGDARAEAGSELGSFHFDSPLGREALNTMVTNIKAGADQGATDRGFRGLT